jgi:hypothetical protein
MNRSDNIANLAGALARAQGAIKGAIKDATNPHFRQKYADLAAVFDACREPLSKQELAILQVPAVEGEAVKVETMLVHSSGEWVSESLVLIPRDMTPQSVGSAITYGRRYGLSSIVGVAPDDDDDGNGATRGNQDLSPDERQQQRREATASTAHVADRLRAQANAGPPSDGTAVTKVETKNGKGNKGPWTKYTVSFADGRKASTFSASIGTQAQVFAQTGEAVIATTTRGDYGLNLEELAPLRAAEGPSGEAPADLPPEPEGFMTAPIDDDVPF